jgi:hypothetical protein
MRWRSRFLALCLEALVLWMGIGSSRLAEAETPGNVATERARELFLEGVKAAQAAQWRQAYASFLSAWSLKKHYQIAANLGDCELRLHLYRDAAEHLAFSLREFPVDASEDERAQTAAQLTRARAKVASVRLDVDVIGVEILVDGRPIGLTPLLDPIFVDPGEHLIEAKSSAGNGRSQSVTLAAGEEIAIELKVGPVRAAPSPVASQPVASRPAASPLRIAPPSPTPAVGRVAPMVIYFGAALSVAAVGVGVGFTLSAASKSAERTARIQGLPGTNACGGGSPYVEDCNAIEQSSATERTYRGFAIGSFAVGGALAAATLALALWPKPSRYSAAAPHLSLHLEGHSGAFGTWTMAF